MKKELVCSEKIENLYNSKDIAEKFGKQHKYVLEKIDRLIVDLSNLDSNILSARGISTKSFIEKFYSYKGKNFRYFKINRPAFTLLIMGFKGRRAFLWKVLFNDAFYLMEEELLKRKNLEWKGDREQGRQIRIELTGVIKKFVDYAISQGSHNASKYYLLITKMEYKALGLIEKNEKVSKDFRNTLDSMDLNHLLAGENVARKAIEEGMERELHYKDIFQLAKKNVMNLADIMVIKKSKQLSLGETPS